MFAPVVPEPLLAAVTTDHGIDSRAPSGTPRAAVSPKASPAGPAPGTVAIPAITAQPAASAAAQTVRLARPKPSARLVFLLI